MRATELDIQTQVCDWLAMQKDLYYTRQSNNATPIRSGSSIVGFRPKGVHEKKGISDIIVLMFCNGQPITIWMEVKTPKGRQSPEQKEFERQVTYFGCLYRVVRSLDEARECIESVRNDAII